MSNIGRFLENNCIDESEKEIVMFGLKRLAVFILSSVIIFILGTLFHEIWRTVLLMALLLPLRQNAGGFHLKSQYGCAICSVLILFIAILCLKYLAINHYFAICLVLISATTIIMMAPISNANNPLDQIEKDVYRMRARMIGLFETVIALSLLGFHINYWAMPVVLSLGITCLLMVVGFVNTLLHDKGDGFL